MTTEERLAELRRMNRHLRALTPDQEDAIRAAVVAGVKPKDLTSVYGVGVRTIYRTLERRHRKARVIQFGDYRAMFEMTDEGPIQLTSWVAA